MKSSYASRGRLSDLLILFFLLLVAAFSSYLYIFVEKVFLARVSVHAMEAAVNTVYACQIFQGASIAIAMMAQVFVGRWFGAQKWSAIGPGVWQFIWFSLFSMLITVPCTLLYGIWYFQGTAIENISLPYFYSLVGTNFLYPLGVSLSCFYLGQGKTSLVLFGNLGAQLLKIGLAYLLIFGMDPWIPSMGLLGGAISTIIAQGGFCLFLGAVFLNSRHSTIFHSRKWQFQWKLFWECIQPGLLRASNRISSFMAWAAIAHLMIAKGGNFLLVLSIGGAFSLFLPFLSEAICQAQTTVVSHLLGARQFSDLNRAFRSGAFLTFTMIALIGFPLLIFPFITMHQLFPGVSLTSFEIRMVLLGVWLSFSFFTLNSIPLSYILAFKNRKFLFLWESSIGSMVIYSCMSLS